MFVTRASPKQLLNFAGAGTADVVPVDGPVKEIHYRDGATCHLTAKSWIGGRYACTPSLPEPYGYRPWARRRAPPKPPRVCTPTSAGKGSVTPRSSSLPRPDRDHRRTPCVLDPMARTHDAPGRLRRHEDRSRRGRGDDRHRADRRSRRARSHRHGIGLAAGGDRRGRPRRAGLGQRSCRLLLDPCSRGLGGRVDVQPHVVDHDGLADPSITSSMKGSRRSGGSCWTWGRARSCAGTHAAGRAPRGRASASSAPRRSPPRAAVPR